MDSTTRKQVERFGAIWDAFLEGEASHRSVTKEDHRFIETEFGPWLRTEGLQNLPGLKTWLPRHSPTAGRRMDMLLRQEVLYRFTNLDLVQLNSSGKKKDPGPGIRLEFGSAYLMPVNEQLM